MNEIRNRVAESGLITIDMKSFIGLQERESIDIAQWLDQGLVLKEKLFREFLNEEEWVKYQNKYVAIYCSVDTIIPIWAYMLVTKYLNPFTRELFGNKYISNFCCSFIISVFLYNSKIFFKLFKQIFIKYFCHL